MRRLRANLRPIKPPAPVLALAGCTALLVAAWAWVNPVFAGAPDENAHVGWVQHVAESWGSDSGARPGYASTEQAEAIVDSHSDFVTGQVELKPPRDRWRYEAWLAKSFTPQQRGDSAGPNPASANPPLYYLAASVPYRLGTGSDLFTRVLLVRLLGLLLGAILVVAVWHLAAEILPPGPGRTAAAAVAGLMPMIGFVEGAVNPDAAMYPAWAFVMLAGVKALRRGERRWVLLMVLGTAVAVAIKYQSLTLLPGVGFVLGALLYRRLPWASSRWRTLFLLGLGLLATVLVVVAGQRGWLGGQVQDIFGAANDRTLPQRFREYASYVWQFYLPRPSFLTEFPIPDTISFWDTVFTQYVGAFGWHEVRLADSLYYAALVVVVVSVALASWGLVRHRAFRSHRGALTYFGLIAIALVLSVHWTEYTMFKNGQQPFVQGRYFLPLNPLFALTVGVAVGPALARWHRVQAGALGAVVASLVLLNLASFGAVLQRFYG